VADQFRLATAGPRDRNSSFRSDSWISANRVVAPATVVNPGEIARLAFTVRATQPGQFQETFSPVIEYRSWVSGGQVAWNINVSSSGIDSLASHYVAQLISQSSPSLTLAPGQSTVVSATFRNTGVAAWAGGSALSYGSVRLGTDSPPDRTSRFHSTSWVSSNRVIGTGLKINPQGELTFGFTITAPAQVGTYSESFRLVSEYIAWFGPTVTWRITVK